MLYPNLKIGLENLLAQDGLTGVEKNKLMQFISQLVDFVSSWFRKTTVLTIPQHKEDFVVSEDAVMGLLATAWEREAERNKTEKNPDPWADPDMWKWDAFKGKTIPGMLKELILCVYRFLKTITHRQILQEGEEKNIKHVGTYLEALLTVVIAIMAGEVDQKNTGVIAYFKVDGNDQLFRFRAWRNDDGQLRVVVFEVVLDDKCGAESGVAFSN